MTKVKFIGKSDENFEYLDYYDLLKFEIRDKFFIAWLSTKKNKIACIPYKSLELFNENWKYKGDL